MLSRNLATSVSDYIEKERIEKIKERESAKKLEDLHVKIMNPLFQPTMPTIPDEGGLVDSSGNLVQSGTFANSGSIAASGKNLMRQASNNSMGSVMTGHLVGDRSLASLGQPKKPVKIMSMSTTLGGKAKAFGTAGVKKKKKGKKTKGKKKKK